jgi:ribosome-binding factor A
MPREFSRTRRVSEQIKRTLSNILCGKSYGDVMLTVTDVNVSPDFHQAEVLVAALGVEAEDQAHLCKVLNQDAARLRHELATHLNLRHTPRLHFRYDQSIARGARIDALLKDIEQGGD